MLALWEYFWTEADWVPAPPEPPAAEPVVVPSAGGGHLDEDYWAVRERYIRRMLQTLEEQLDNATPDSTLEPIDALPPLDAGSQLALRDLGPPSYASVELVHALERQARAVQLARIATTRTELQRAGSLIAATSRAIARLKHQHEMENIAVAMALMF